MSLRSDVADDFNPPIFSAQQVERGRLQAILSYLVPFFLIVPLRRRDNPFTLFHARQALTLWLAALAAMLALTIGLILLTVLLMAVPISVTIGLIVLAVLIVAGFVAFIGARTAWSGGAQVLPYVGRFGETHMTLIVKD